MLFFSFRDIIFNRLKPKLLSLVLIHKGRQHNLFYEKKRLQRQGDGMENIITLPLQSQKKLYVTWFHGRYV